MLRDFYRVLLRCLSELIDPPYMETTVRASTTKLKGSRFDRRKFKKVRGISKYEKGKLSEKSKNTKKERKTYSSTGSSSKH
jgi:hypothetical protein